MAPNLKILYLFAGQRPSYDKNDQKGLLSDTYLIGLNHMREYGIEADFLETGLMNRLRRINYNLASLPAIFSIRKYDIVFSGASLFFPFLVRGVLRIKKPKLVWYNTFFTNSLKRSSGIKRRIILKTIKSLDAVICPSKSQRDFLIKEGVDGSKVFLVLNGIDRDYIDKIVQTGIGGEVGEKYILSVGKDNGRDYKTLIEAVRGLDVKLKIVAMPRNVSGLQDVPENVEILGPLPFEELVRLYKNAEFVVIPTKKDSYLDASDCSGQYVFLESLAFGKAVIVSERSTLSDYIEGGSDGVMVPSEDPNALRCAIVELLSNPQKRQLLEEKAREASSKFTTIRLARDLSEIFKQL